MILDIASAKMPHVEAARRALAGGAKVIQLRDKHARFEELVEIGSELRALCTEHCADLIVNDNPYLAQEIGADGVHLGQSDFPPYIAREILGPAGIIGISTHTKEQALHATTLGVDYIAVGPVFPTESKISANKPVGVEHVRWVKRNVRIPVVAIGGITSGTVNEIIRAGAENIGVIREVMASDNIELRTRELCDLIHQARQEQAG